MSLRTGMLSRAAPGCTRTMRMSCAWAVRSRAYMASAVASASACASAAVNVCSVMNFPSGMDGTLDQRRNAVAVFAVAGAEVGQDIADRCHAHGIGPGERPLRVIDAESHGRIGGVFGADTLIDGIGRFVGEHGDGAHDGKARHIQKTADGKAGCLQET